MMTQPKEQVPWVVQCLQSCFTATARCTLEVTASCVQKCDPVAHQKLVEEEEQTSPTASQKLNDDPATPTTDPQQTGNTNALTDLSGVRLNLNDALDSAIQSSPLLLDRAPDLRLLVRC